MPRTAILFIAAFWGALVVEAQAQSPLPQTFDYRPSNRMPAPPAPINLAEDRAAPSRDVSSPDFSNSDSSVSGSSAPGISIPSTKASGASSNAQPVANQEMTLHKSLPANRSSNLNWTSDPQKNSVGRPTDTDRRSVESPAFPNPTWKDQDNTDLTSKNLKASQLPVENESTSVPSEAESSSLLSPLPVPAPPVKVDDQIVPASFLENEKQTELSTKSDVTAASEPKPAEPQEKTPIPPKYQSKISPAPSGKLGNTASSLSGGLPTMVSVAGSTGIVLGIFLLAAWVMKRKMPQALTRLPGEAFEVLGRAPLNGKQQVHLLRCGNKLLLVSVTQGGAETLTEITDPAEVDRLAGLCRQTHPSSSSAAFQQIFAQLAPRRPSSDNSSKRGIAGWESSESDYGRGLQNREDRHGY